MPLSCGGFLVWEFHFTFWVAHRSTSARPIGVLEHLIRTCFPTSGELAKQREYENGPSTPEPSGEAIVRGRDRRKRKEAELYAPDPIYR